MSPGPSSEGSTPAAASESRASHARVWVVIPAYNENEAIRAVVQDLLDRGHEVVVVDDGSRTPLLPVLQGLAVHALRHAINLGQGAALQTGISYALQRGAELIVTFDADGQHQSADIPALVAPIVAGEVDVVLGSRFREGGRAVHITRTKRLVLKLAVAFTRATTGLAVTDTHNGLRALSRSAAERLQITQNGMAHASQILQEIANLKLAFREVPVTIVYTEYSVRKGQRLSNAFNILWDSFAEFFYR
jgi:glycosyltransferase involved in cell wall biosynthesis